MPTDLGDSAMRERFEKWALTWTPVISLAKREDGSYYDISTTWAWQIWQAAQLTPEKIEELARRISDEIVKGMYRPESVKRVLREYLGGQR